MKLLSLVLMLAFASAGAFADSQGAPAAGTGATPAKMHKKHHHKKKKQDQAETAK